MGKNPKNNNNETEVQAAIVVIISHIVVPFLIKSVAYVSNKLLEWVINDSSDEAISVEIDFSENPLVDHIDFSS